MSTLTFEFCEEAQRVSSTFALKCVFAVKLLCCGLGTIFVLFLVRRKGSAWIPNPNAKLLYRVHIILAIHVAVTFSFLYAFELYRLFTAVEPRDYIMNARIACLIRLVPVMGVIAQSFNMFAFAIERTISTIIPRTYEKCQCCFLGLALCIISLSCAVTMVYFWDYAPISANTVVTVISVKNHENHESFDKLVHVQLAMEIATVVIFCTTDFVNARMSERHKTDTEAQLGDRYQVLENLTVIRVLLPCFILHFVLNCVTLVGLLLYSWLHPTIEPASMAIWTECVAQAQNYALFMPLILFWRTRTVEQVGIYDPVAITDAYFRNLNEIFNRGA